MLEVIASQRRQITHTDTQYTWIYMVPNFQNPRISDQWHEFGVDFSCLGTYRDPTMDVEDSSSSTSKAFELVLRMR